MGPGVRDAFWLSRDYLPAVRAELDASLAAARPRSARRARSPCRSRTTAATASCCAYWRRPEAYLDPAVRANISVFALLPAAEEEAMVAALRADLESGAWAERNADLLELDALDLGYRILVAE